MLRQPGVLQLRRRDRHPPSTDGRSFATALSLRSREYSGWNGLPARGGAPLVLSNGGKRPRVGPCTCVNDEGRPIARPLDRRTCSGTTRDRRQHGPPPRARAAQRHRRWRWKLPMPLATWRTARSHPSRWALPNSYPDDCRISPRDATRWIDSTLSTVRRGSDGPWTISGLRSSDRRPARQRFTWNSSRSDSEGCVSPPFSALVHQHPRV